MAAGSATQEAGAQDNLLQWNPNDEAMKALEDLEEGQEYTITLKCLAGTAGTATPTECVSVKPATRPGAGGEEVPEEEEMGAMGKARDYPNPAVRGLVAGEKT